MEVFESLHHLMGWQVVPVLVFLVIATVTDIQSKKIRNWTTGSLALYNAAVFIILPAAQGEWHTAFTSVLGGLLAFGVLLVPAAYFVISMGGDIKLAGACGIALGSITAVAWVMISAGLVIAYGSLAVKIKGKSPWDTVPFAPFFLAGFVFLLAGHWMWFV